MNYTGWTALPPRLMSSFNFSMEKELRNARMGGVQINPLYGTETSWEGNNDTTSLEKTIMSTVSATFSLR